MSEASQLVIEEMRNCVHLAVAKELLENDKYRNVDRESILKAQAELEEKERYIDEKLRELNKIDKVKNLTRLY